MNGNGFISTLLRSPLHGLLSKGMMLVTVHGRKTGKDYTTPVGYFSEGDALWVMTSRDRTWWRNLKSGADVGLLLRGKQVQGFAELVLDENTVASRVTAYLRHEPRAARPLGIRVESGIPNKEDVTRVAKGRLFVRICLRTPVFGPLPIVS
ncbi:MAG: nitroreductase/quinone reductase family protein [Chloroflexota bacterium]